MRGLKKGQSKSRELKQETKRREKNEKGEM